MGRKYLALPYYSQRAEFVCLSERFFFICVCGCVGTAAKDAFKAFDKKNENKIKVGDLEAAMKRIGHTIKPDWLEKVEHMIDSAGGQV